MDPMSTSGAIAVRNEYPVPDASMLRADPGRMVSPNLSASRSVRTDCQAPVSMRKSSVFPLIVTGTEYDPGS